VITARTDRIVFPAEHDWHVDAMSFDALLARVSLARLPALPPLDPPPEDRADPADWLRGVAIADGRVFWVRGDGRMIAVVECDGTTSAVFGCGRPLGSDGRMSGLAATSSELFVSLPDDGAVVAYELTTAQVSRVWTGLDQPGDLAVSPSHAVYVATSSGIVDLGPGGAATLVQAVGDVHSLTWARLDDQEMLIIAAGSTSVRAVAIDGSAIAPSLPTERRFDGPALVRWSNDRLIIASVDAGVVGVWDTSTGSWLGAMVGDPVGLVGLTTDSAERWWMSDGSAVVGTGAETPVHRGSVTVGPIPIPPEPDLRTREWLRLKLRGELGPVRVRSEAIFGRADGLAVPSPTLSNPAIDGADRMIQIPAGATAVTVHVELSDPVSSPEDPTARHWIDAIELRYDERSLIEFLPAIYRAQGEPEAFLDPFMRLLSSGNHDLLDALVDLPDQFDPRTVIDDLDGARWLDWLATWVDARIDDQWPGERRRRVVAEAFERHARRGTPDAIRHRIELELGIQATIVEPGDLANPWVLGDPGIELGMTAMLADAPAGGSVVDTTAIVDRSHLIGTGEIGAPLFGDLAHRFHVLVHAADVQCERLDQLVAIIDREKPAHTHSHICRLEPGIHLGIGGHVGLDLVIGPVARSMDGLGGFSGDRGADVALPRLGDPTPEPLILT